MEINLQKQTAGLKKSLEMFSRALRESVSRIRISKEANLPPTICFERENSELEQEIISDEVFESLYDFFEQRSFAWNESNGSTTLKSSQGNLKFLLAPLAAEKRLSADVSFSNSSERNLITISDIKNTSIPALSESLDFHPETKNMLLAAIKNRNGLMLSNMNKANISGNSILLSMRPDAIFIKKEDNAYDLSEIISLSKTKLVLLSSSWQDPVEALWQIHSECRDQQIPLQDLSAHLLFAFIHKKIKKQCAACAKSTNISIDAAKKLPEVIQKSLGKTYMFSRGCSQCNFSSFKGTSDASSALLIDQAIRTYINNSSLEPLLVHASRNGLKSLLQDGLWKVFQGLTSFEEVLSQLPAIPEGYVEALNKIAATESKAQIKRSPDSALNMLIVEDDSNQRDVLQMVFKSEGFEVTIAENGKIALEKMSSQSFDIILSDVMMPVMSGIDMVKELKSNQQTQNIPVLMLTAVSNSEDEYEVLTYGADDYCDKNVKKKILIKRVERLLKEKMKTSENPLGHMID